MKTVFKHLGRLLLAVALVLTGVMLGTRFQRPPAAVDATKALWTCSMHPQVLQDKPGICPICAMKLVPLRKNGAAAPPGRLAIDPSLTQNIGVRYATVEQGPLRLAVRSVGYVREAEPLQRDVSLKIAGWIRKLHADTEGASIREGDPLFELYSPELLVAQNELLAARRAPGEAALVDASRQRLRLWDVPAEDIDALLAAGKASGTATFRSPADGFVLEKNVVQGSAVEASQKLFRIVDLSTVWIDVQVYDAQVMQVGLGRKATARVGALPGREFAGDVVFVSPRIDPTTRTGTVRLAFPNPGVALRPGMYATVELSVPVSDAAILVPREAVIDSGVRQVAFVAGAPGHFEARNVKMGLETGTGSVQILSGLAPGEKVVVSGQFLLDAESRLREAIRKIESPGPAPAPGVDAVTRAYLALSDALAADKAVDEAQVQALIQAAKANDGEAVATAVEHMCCVPLKEQRERFKKVSEAMIARLQRGGGTSPLYLIRCPMAEARWLQASDKIANPYLGAAMRSCGEVLAR